MTEDSTDLQVLIQREALEMRVCVEFDLRCGKCVWCYVRPMLKAAGD